MFEFKGFDDWIPIFRGGKQTDSLGREHDGDALIDRAVASFDVGRHEPPVCIGHPADNAPAWGWVQGLKKVPQRGGALLMAKFRQVQPAFADMVKNGLFKKRSSAFYPDGSLRHVAFLGAAPPAVKGLPDVAFSEEAGPVFEFSDYRTAWSWEAIARLFGKLRDYLIEKEGMEKADQVIAAYQIQEISDAAAKEKQEIKDQNAAQAAANYREKEESIMTFKEKLVAVFNEIVGKLPDDGPAAAPVPAGRTFTETDVAVQVKTAADEAARKEREKMTAEFAEKERKTRQEARKKEIGVWCDAQVKEGRLTPSMVKFGIPEMLLAFAEREDIIEFGESKEKTTLFDRFKTLIEKELPKLVTFREVAGRDKDVGGANAKEAAIAKFMEGNKGVSYKDAVLAVSKDHPELFREEV